MAAFPGVREQRPRRDHNQASDLADGCRRAPEALPQLYRACAENYEDTGGHVEYNFSVVHRSGLTWRVAKRYSDFDQLHADLAVDRQLGWRLPSLPEKSWLPNFAQALVSDICEQRKMELQEYLEALLADPEVSKHRVVQQFFGVMTPEPPAGLRVVQRPGGHELEVRPPDEGVAPVDGYSIEILHIDTDTKYPFHKDVGAAGTHLQKAQIGQLASGGNKFTVAAYNAAGVGSSISIIVNVKNPGDRHGPAAMVDEYEPIQQPSTLPASDAGREDRDRRSRRGERDGRSRRRDRDEGPQEGGERPQPQAMMAEPGMPFDAPQMPLTYFGQSSPSAGPRMPSGTDRQLASAPPDEGRPSDVAAHGPPPPVYEGFEGRPSDVAEHGPAWSPEGRPSDAAPLPNRSPVREGRLADAAAHGRRSDLAFLGRPDMAALGLQLPSAAQVPSAAQAGYPALGQQPGADVPRDLASATLPRGTLPGDLASELLGAWPYGQSLSARAPVSQGYLRQSTQSAAARAAPAEDTGRCGLLPARRHTDNNLGGSERPPHGSSGLEQAFEAALSTSRAGSDSLSHSGGGMRPLGASVLNPGAGNASSRISAPSASGALSLPGTSAMTGPVGIGTNSTSRSAPGTGVLRPPATGGSNLDDDDQLCVICLSEPKTHAFVPCGHRCVCSECGTGMLGDARRATCPICRAEVTQIMQIWG